MNMQFEPRPLNDFEDFIATYFGRCTEVCPTLKVIAGKWTFEDLIPGMSDFDTRLIFSDNTTLSDWVDMSIAVGQVHTSLARERPEWARILEHLPGLDLTLAETTSPARYYPEFQLWTFYDGDHDYLGAINTYLENKEWAARDELFHLKKFALYFGPYRRGIDPAVNLGKFENKYPLHSRFMHYFTPPIQSAVSLIRKKGIRGKMEALRTARDLFPNPEVIDIVFEAVDCHYELESWYEDTELAAIEERLHAYLKDVCKTLSEHVTLIDFPGSVSPADLKSMIAEIPVDPAEAYYEGAKFCRFMKGRLIFYGTDIAWFDTTWLIHNELGRIVTNFYRKPLVTYGIACFNQELTADAVLERLEGNVLSPEICSGVRNFKQVAGQPVWEGREKEHALAVAEVFEPVQYMIEKLGEEIAEHGRGTDK